jgi:hypothetical protein
MKTIATIVVLLSSLLVGNGTVTGDSGPDIFGHKSGIWQIEGTAGQKRWLIIHNLEDAKNIGLFHIEIIGRNKGQPVWSIVRLCDHMAISQEALRRSVIRPLKSGGVYPESFDAAYAKWKNKSDQGRSDICTTTVADCLRSR